MGYGEKSIPASLQYFFLELSNFHFKLDHKKDLLLGKGSMIHQTPPTDLSYEKILIVVTAFYQKATRDVIIGYHFRTIHDFETHLPRIADFWELQLLGTITHRESLPFELFKVHKALMIKKAQVRRWVILFLETLEESSLSQPAKDLWKERIEFFQLKFLHHPYLYSP